MDFREILREVVEWIHVAQGRENWWALLKTGSVKDREFLD
jgi:hypothetical protein